MLMPPMKSGNYEQISSYHALLFVLVTESGHKSELWKDCMHYSKEVQTNVMIHTRSIHDIETTHEIPHNEHQKPIDGNMDKDLEKGKSDQLCCGRSDPIQSGRI